MSFDAGIKTKNCMLALTTPGIACLEDK